MDEFQPLPLDAFQNERDEMWTQMRPLNAHLTDGALKDFIDSQIQSGRSDQMQFMDKFIEQYASESIAITVLSHTLVEAIINAALILGLEHSGKTDLFLILESANVKNKWSLGPKSFLPNYSLPTSEALFGTLPVLYKLRNAYVHSKITLRDEAEQVVWRGSIDDSLSLSPEGRNRLHGFFSLPYDLHQHRLKQVDDATLRFRLKHLLEHGVDTKRRQGQTFFIRRENGVWASILS